MSAHVRTGKIARLPRDVREELNRRLQDGEPGKTLVPWLNAHPKVQAMLKTHFSGRVVTVNNLSEWTQGGYRDWLVQQEAVEAVQRMEAESEELAETSETPVINLLSQRLAARYAVAAQALTRADGQIDVKLLRELCSDVVALRRSEQRADRLKIEQDRLKLVREQFKSDSRQVEKMQEKELLQWAWTHRELVLAHIKRRVDDRDLIERALMADAENERRAREQRERAFKPARHKPRVKPPAPPKPSAFAKASADTSASTKPAADTTTDKPVSAIPPAFATADKPAGANGSNGQADGQHGGLIRPNTT
jgi:hypothetical protein